LPVHGKRLLGEIYEMLKGQGGVKMDLSS